MRLKVTVGENSKIYRFPWSYNYYVASSIYYLLNKYYPKYSFIIHEKGWGYKNKNLKLFTFSPLFPKNFSSEKNFILMTGPLTFLVSSPDSLFIELLENAMRKEGILKIFKYRLPLLNLKVFEITELEKKIFLKTLSPLMVSVKEKKRDKIYSIYLSPDSPLFVKRLKNLICLKFEAFTGEKIFEDEINIIPKSFSSKLISIKNINLKGYNAELEMESDIQIIRFAIDSGLGEKTSMGFGMVEKIDS